MIGRNFPALTPKMTLVLEMIRAEPGIARAELERRLGRVTDGTTVALMGRDLVREERVPGRTKRGGIGLHYTIAYYPMETDAQG